MGYQWTQQWTWINLRALFIGTLSEKIIGLTVESRKDKTTSLVSREQNTSVLWPQTYDISKQDFFKKNCKVYDLMT